MNPARITLIRRFAHDGIRDAHRMIETAKKYQDIRSEIVIASQEVKITTLENLLLLLKDNISLSEQS